MNENNFQPDIQFAVQLLKRKKGFAQKQIAPAIGISPSYLTKLMKEPELAIGKYHILDALLGFLREQELEELYKEGIDAYRKNYAAPAESRSITNPEEEELRYDFFLASPKLSFEKKLQRHDHLQHAIEKALHSFMIEENSIADYPGFQEWASKIKTQILWSFFDSADIQLPSTKEYNRFNSAVRKLYKNLCQQGYSVKFPRNKQNLEQAIYRDPPSVFNEDYKYLLQSRYYLIVSPYPRLFSSAWVELGIALGLNKPVLIITRNKETDIPHIITQRPNNKSIYHKVIHTLEQIPDQYLWIENLDIMSNKETENLDDE